MDEANNIEALIGFVRGAGKKHVKVQTAWAIAKEIDWDAKKMDAIGVADDLAYFGVLLGIGSEYRKPKENTLCLIGLIENNAAATFLIYAEELEETVFNGGEHKGLVKVSELTTQLNAIERDINKLKSLFGSWVPVAQDGGAALKTALSDWISNNIIESSENDLQNDKIKH